VNTLPDLLKAVRTGKLSAVLAVLDAGTSVELDDGKGNPGLPLAMSCFLGHAEIVRELLLRGATVNFSDNSIPSSPLSMAVRAHRTEVIKVLIEYGAVIPEGMETGLHKDELMLARWKAQHLGVDKAAAVAGQNEPIEEIQVIGCYGTDTDILDAEMRRAIEALPPKNIPPKKASP
jgi:ankyrin repeat protein